MTKEQDLSEFDAVIALGSNIGDKFANIAEAIERLTQRGDIRLVGRSRNFKTPPWGKTDQDWFANAVISVATSLPARTLLEACQAVERDMGRERIEKWGPRIIDLDILTFQDTEITEADFVVPHPYLTERAFVLAPMADVTPELVVKGRTVSQWLSDHDCSGIEPVEAN